MGMAWAPDYLTVAELRAYRSLDVDDTAEDVDLAVSITAASRAIDRHCNRQFGIVAAPELRYYTAWYDSERCRWVVDIDDLATTTGLVLEVDGEAVTTYKLGPRNAVAKGKVWTQLYLDDDSECQPTGAEDEIEMTASWGWPAFPVSVKQAAYIQSQRFSKRKESPYGIAGSPEAGTEMRLLSRVDPDVGVALADYVRPRRPQ
jgi:hypothetical protein